MLLGDEGVLRLKSSAVLAVGLGGVGIMGGRDDMPGRGRKDDNCRR